MIGTGGRIPAKQETDYGWKTYLTLLQRASLTSDTDELRERCREAEQYIQRHNKKINSTAISRRKLLLQYQFKLTDLLLHQPRTQKTLQIIFSIYQAISDNLALIGSDSKYITELQKLESQIRRYKPPKGPVKREEKSAPSSMQPLHHMACDTSASTSSAMLAIDAPFGASRSSIRTQEMRFWDNVTTIGKEEIPVRVSHPSLETKTAMLTRAEPIPSLSTQLASSSTTSLLPVFSMDAPADHKEATETLDASVRWHNDTNETDDIKYQNISSPTTGRLNFSSSIDDGLSIEPQLDLLADSLGGILLEDASSCESSLSPSPLASDALADPKVKDSVRSFPSLPLYNELTHGFTSSEQLSTRLMVALPAQESAQLPVHNKLAQSSTLSEQPSIRFMVAQPATQSPVRNERTPGVSPIPSGDRSPIQFVTVPLTPSPRDALQSSARKSWSNGSVSDKKTVVTERTTLLTPPEKEPCCCIRIFCCCISNKKPALASAPLASTAPEKGPERFTMS